MWGKYGSKIGVLTRYADDFVIVCKTSTDAKRAMALIRKIMERLELTLHPTKTKIVGLWDGKEGFDFLGMHFRKAKAENAKGKIYYTMQYWLTKKAAKHIREIIKERLAPPSARVQSLKEHIEYLKPKIHGWRNYYASKWGNNQMKKLDYYILYRFVKWKTAKAQRRNFGKGMMSQMYRILTEQGLPRLYVSECA